jgi:hypothetical protein
MREAEKQIVLRTIAARIDAAAGADLPATAQSWRDLYVTVEGRSAASMLFVKRPEPYTADR